MRKVVLKCESENQIADLQKNLDKEKIDYVMWTEQPENIVTCLATAPKEMDILKPFFKHFKLFS